MDSDTWRAVEANLFPAARPAVDPHDAFPWHGDGIHTAKRHSSQALAIDVFGTLSQSPQRDGILNALLTGLGLQAGSDWQVQLEWRDPARRLWEPTRTQVDALARSDRHLVFFECKFTESDAGRCGQTGSSGGGVRCDGNYHPQVDAASGTRYHCALTAKGIRYWDVIPRLFAYDRHGAYEPCPFAGPWYQWMRNMVLCSEVAATEGLQPVFVVAYADAPHLPVAKMIRSRAWGEFMAQVRQDAMAVRTLSMQSMVLTAQAAVAGSAETQTWRELDAWVQAKVADTVPRLARPVRRSERVTT
jgi:hypothetical protein